MFAAFKILISRWLQPVDQNSAELSNASASNMFEKYDGANQINQAHNIGAESAVSDIVPYDENLLERSRTQWQFGDWETLAAISREELQHHPDRAKLALLAAAGHSQIGDMERARQFTRLADDWGVSKKLISQVLVSGVFNSLGRAYAHGKDVDRSVAYFDRAIATGSPTSDVRLVSHARTRQQLASLGLNQSFIEPTGIKLKNLETGFAENRSKGDSTSSEIDNKIDGAKKAIDSQRFDDAEIALQDVLKDQPLNETALQELIRVKVSKKEWGEAAEVYEHLIKKNNTAMLSAVLGKARMLFNSDKLTQAITELETVKSLGHESVGLAYQLAVAYRNNQQFDAAEQQVDHILKRYPKYVTKKLAFAIFASDFLRKLSRVQEAKNILQKGVEAATVRNEYVSLTSKAMLAELIKTDKHSSFSLEVSKSFYDDIYSESEIYNSSPENSVYLPVWHCVLENIKANIIKNIVDVGCGPGQFAQYLFNHISNISYTGLDFSSVAIQLAKLRCSKGQFFVKNILESDSLGNFDVDLYIALEVLEHIDKDLDLIERIPLGKLVIFSVPNFDSFGHVRFFKNEESIMNRYQRYFDKIKVQTVSITLPSKIFVFKGIRNCYKDFSVHEP